MTSVIIGGPTCSVYGPGEHRYVVCWGGREAGQRGSASMCPHTYALLLFGRFPGGDYGVRTTLRVTTVFGLNTAGPRPPLTHARTSNARAESVYLSGKLLASGADRVTTLRSGCGHLFEHENAVWFISTCHHRHNRRTNALARALATSPAVVRVRVSTAVGRQLRTQRSLALVRHR